MTEFPLAAWQVAVFLPAAFLMGLTPGPNNFLAMATAGRAGPGPALRGLGGRCAAFAILVILVAFGLDRLLAGSQLAFAVLKWGGVAYLCYLAWRTWTAPVDGGPDPSSGGWREFLTCMANPKAYLLMTAFLPQFLTTGDPLLQLLALGVLYIVMEALAALVWIGAGALMHRGALTPRGRLWLNRLFGGLLGGAALLLARATQPG
ncbi:LysE family translocator [Jannaschia seohaensis]|uniref:Threonine/homoserine/homoserine lactone efflux protein n=1 Tax=Jannaschia seohaensis TaxID=475081 RepID=A0A2Y9BXW5_9RHOB|nr:LysE family translocator [Jannaschia seohaensis]PWJ21152.1 threonine/homoserine/homoserine lactone efflux protein [Jannaschia seohaensis]SSA41562.1 Threonine/homoserine/homoserine lactone efflux protein [Jannaschia seohaensis]